MSPLIAFSIATSVWGFSLEPPTLAATGPGPVAEARAAIEAEPFRADADLEAIAQNYTLMEVTRAFQLVSTIAMAVTTVFGFIQFGDEYGFHDVWDETACESGTPVFDYCGGATPIPHVIAVGTTAATSLTAIILSTQVDFELAGSVDRDWRIYETTRWIALAMTAVQAVGGLLLASSTRVGWADPQADFDTLQGLAAAHMGWGVATLALETYNTALLF